MKRILAMLLSVICVLSFTCVSTYADEKSEDEEKAASIAESYLSAAAKNMWLYESNNLAEHTIQELVDTSGNSLLSDMSTDVMILKVSRYCGSFVLNEMCQNRAANYTPVAQSIR